MATGGCTQEKLSEEVFDFVCTPCASEDKSRRAEKYCESCKIYYCTDCFSHHNAIFKNHSQLGPQEFRGKSTFLLPIEQCILHGNELQMYCTDHDKVVCNTCVSIQHRSCTRIVFIPNEVQKLLKATPIKTVKAEVSTIQATLKDDEKSADAQMRKLSEKKNGIIEEIENQGHMLKTMIDGLVKQSIEDVEGRFDNMSKKIQDVIRKIQDNQREMDHGAKQIELAEKQKNDSQMFVSLKKCQTKLTESEKNHKDFTTWKDSVKLEYGFNRKIENSLKQFISLGSVTDQNTTPSLYKDKGQKTVQVCKKEDTCSIGGSCQLQDGSFLLTDWHHKNIVHLDSSCSMVIDQCQVPDNPLAVCLTGENEAAVSLQNIKTILFVSLGTKMTLTRSVQLQHCCGGLAFSQGKLFVSDRGGQVHVYDTAGNPCRILGTSTSDQGSVFSYARHIAISQDGQRMYVADWYKGLVCVDQDGKLMFTYKDSQLSKAHGVCMDHHGSVFVCGYNSNNVIQLSADGKNLGVLLKQSHGINKPLSVCFDSINKRLLVTMERNNSISVTDLK